MGLRTPGAADVGVPRRAVADHGGAAARGALRALGSPPLFDLALAALLGVLTVSTTLTHTAGESGPALAAALLIGLSQATATIWRRAHAVGVLAALSATVTVPFLLGLPVSDRIWLVAVYSVFVYRPWRVAVPAFGLAVAVIPVCAGVRTLLQDRPWWPHLADWTLSLLPLLLAAAALGLTVGADRARTAARRAAAEQAHRAEALARHRARIAEDLDAVVTVEVRDVADRCAGLLAHRVTGPERVAEQLEEIRRRARDGLGTMRLLLEQLRIDAPSVASARPAPPPRRPWWRPTRSGLVVVGALAVLVVLVSRFPVLLRIPGVTPAELNVDTTSPATVALLAVQVGSFAWWRSAPAAALLVNAAASAAASALGSVNYVAATAPVLLYYTAGAGAPIVVSAAAVTVALALQVGVDLAAGAGTGAAYAFSVALAAAVWLVGVAARRAADRARSDDDSRRADDRRRALTDQRDRITRELHDLVGHHLSAVAVQAGAAARAARRGHVDDVALEQLAGSAADAVRGLPTVTSTSSDPPDLGRLTAAEVERVVAPLRAAGLPVTVRVRADEGERTAGETDLFARRILQEALTNAIRHGGAAPTSVDVEDTVQAVTVSVRSQPPDAEPDELPGSGQGLSGMRERAALLGGQLHAGRRPDGGWRVHAVLPRRPEAAPTLTVGSAESSESSESSGSSESAGPGA